MASLQSSSAPNAPATPPQTSSPSADPAAPSPRSSWVILGSIPRVVQGGGAAAEDADLSLALTAPPRVSLLTVSERVFPDRPTAKNFPFVLAADSSGLILLSALLPAPRTRVDIDRPGNQSFQWRDYDSRFFVLDATTGSAFRLPDPEPQEPIEHQALLGILARPGGGYMVAELLPVFGEDTADLRCYSSDVGEWVDKSVHYPLPPRPLEPICTLAHAGRLWWVDYSWGIITSDPFADAPVLRFVPLPRPCVLEYKEAPGVLDKFRYVGVSAGKLRFVDTYRRGGAPTKVTVWTLPDADATEWKLEHEANFADIGADDSYKATGLPKKVPVLALIHPHNPAVVYFFLEGHLLGVDVPARKVVECDRYHLVAPPRDYPIANRFIRAWELPESVSTDLGNWPSDIGSTEPAEVPSYQRRRGDYDLVGNSRISPKLLTGAMMFAHV
ncbi:unnamed protein product [Urochloa decumbens]|uniref:DUF1618 domain-containing protein n=1 Tax=Urochloa decumbens TaxID=240449 RepID=A0ABC9BGK2_9POAL